MKQPVPVFEGDIVDKKLTLLGHVRKAMARWCSTFANGTHVDIVIRKHSSKRTLDQNAYYWGVVINVLAREFGYDPDEMHMVLREKFLRIHDEAHPDFVIAKSTTKLDTVGFVEYIEKIQRWAATEYQIFIPNPEKAEAQKEG